MTLVKEQKPHSSGQVVTNLTPPALSGFSPHKKIPKKYCDKCCFALCVVF